MKRPLALLASSALVLVSGEALAQSNEARAIQLEEVTVEGSQNTQTGPITADGYVATSSSSATKTDTLILETPQSISTVTQQQLEDRKPQTLLDAVSYTPGVRIGGYGFDPRYDAFTIRGIDVTYTGVFREGLRQVNSPNGLFRLEPYGLEGITILRGPAASIYGASSTGGIVDLISKRPTFLPFREVEVQTGSYGRIQGNFDLSGPVTSDNTLFYRLTGLVRDAGTEIGAVPDDRVFIAPALTWKPTDATTLTILGEYMDATTGGTAAYLNNYATDAAGNPTSLSIGATRVFAGDKRYNDFRQQQGRIGYEFEHRFNDMFTLRQHTRFSRARHQSGICLRRFRPHPREQLGGRQRYPSRKPRENGPGRSHHPDRLGCQPSELRLQAGLRCHHPRGAGPGSLLSRGSDPDPDRDLRAGSAQVAELAPDSRRTS